MIYNFFNYQLALSVLIMQKSIQAQIDELFQIETRQQMRNKLIQLQHKDKNIYDVISQQIKHIVISEPEYTTNVKKLYALEGVCKLDMQVDLGCFKVNNIYQLVAVSQGYIDNSQDIKGNFSRNLKRNSQFWGVTSIQIIYKALVNTVTPTIHKTADIKTKQYLWQFVKNNSQIFPLNFDFYQYAIKHLLMLRPDKKQQSKTFHLVLQIFNKYQYSYQALSKNFRFILQFFRSAYTQKEIAYFPYISCLHFIKNFNNFQVDKIFAIGALGLNWSQLDVLNCTNNVFKLGITDQTYRLLKAFIQMFKSSKKYPQLANAFQKNIHKIFVFLKYPQLYPSALKTLKQFILGPWSITNLYNIFVTKAVQFAKLKKMQQHKDFLLLLVCVVQKYKQSTLVTDLENIIKQNNKNGQILHDKIRAQTLEYDWRVFQKANSSKKDVTNQQECNYQNRGIINIGNSCYMNSFLQCLFMTKEYRRTVLEASTLNVEKQVLTKYEQLDPNHAAEGRNLAMLARQTVRPLAQLQRTFSLLLKSKRSAINPTNVRNISPIQFRNTHQHDSIQFGRFLIQTISRSIEHVFEGQMTTQIQCPYCGVKRQKNEQFLDLMLSSNNEDTQNIEEMIKISLQDEYLQDLKCQACNNKAPKIIDQNKMQQQNVQKQAIAEQTKKSIKRHWISKYPNYLILTLKRFQYNIKQNKNIKKQYKLQLNQQFKINDVEYLIYSIIVHRGVSANSGHYFTFSRFSYLQNIKNWLCLNDSVVSKIDNFGKVLEFLNTNLQDTPYIIFAIEKKYWLQNSKKLQQPLTLRAPLQSFVQKDDIQYVKSMNKKGTIDLSMLKFATGNQYRRDDDDNNNQGNGPGFSNNPIM